MGHPIDKIELIVLGGTVLEYPRQYLTWFTTQCFYSCNTYPYKNSRKMLSLEEEQKINETSNVRIIGYTLETRPDGITDESVYFLRNLGVTRMQIGIQHTSNRILKKVNRGHTIEDSMNALDLASGLFQGRGAERPESWLHAAIGLGDNSVHTSRRRLCWSFLGAHVCTFQDNIVCQERT